MMIFSHGKAKSCSKAIRTCDSEAKVAPEDKAPISSMTAVFPINNCPKATIAIVRIPQSKTWVRPTKPIPIIFPIIRSKGFTDETITSMMRFVFSSITPCITIEPYIVINIYINKVASRPKTEATSKECVVVASPSSPHFTVRT